MRPVEDIETDSYRVNTYRLLARLLSAPADADLLVLLAAIEDKPAVEKTPLTKAWTDLAAAAKKTNAEAVNDEFHALFIGVSRGEILPYGSYYQTGFLMEKPLALLRSDLLKLGLQRQTENHEPEDHVAALCEIMSLLITDGNSQQGLFYQHHIGEWIGRFFDDLERSDSAVFYRAVARLGTAFFNFEQTFLLTIAHA